MRRHAMTMRAALMHGKGDIRIEDVPEPAPGPDELLLEVHAAGICGSDLHEYLHGPAMFPIPGPHPITGHKGPMTPGHEFGGTVIEVGSNVSGFGVGDLVASGAGVSCGSCFQCVTGRTNLCVDYTTVGLQRHGGLAQYVAVPAAACLEVGSLGLTTDSATLVQPMSIAVHAARRGRPEVGEDLVVVGAGGIGAFIVYVLSQLRHRVIAVDLSQERLDTATFLGADLTVLGGDEAARELSVEAPNPRVVYEATGSPAGLEFALQVSPQGSRVVVVGLQPRSTEIDLKQFTLDERELIGTNAHAFPADFPTAAELVAARDGWSDIAPVALPLEELVGVGLSEMSAGTSSRIKTLIDPWIGEPRQTQT